MRKAGMLLAIAVGVSAIRRYPEIRRVHRSIVVLNSVDISSVIQPNKGGKHEYVVGDP